jgi:LPS O-antigen subunit length determinant protein (WzzB/FepE family)
MLTIAIEWKDPVLATAWVDALIARVNTFVNEATVREAEQNLKFLDQQAKTTSVVELQKTIFSMMEGEIKRVMVARYPETAPLRVVDPAVVPERSVRPKRALIVILGILAGGLLGGMIVLARSAMRG